MSVDIPRDQRQAYRNRVIDAVGPTWRMKKDILAAARMDTATCLRIIDALAEEGVLEKCVEKPRLSQFGKPAQFFRRRVS